MLVKLVVYEPLSVTVTPNPLVSYYIFICIFSASIEFALFWLAEFDQLAISDIFLSTLQANASSPFTMAHNQMKQENLLKFILTHYFFFFSLLIIRNDLAIHLILIK